MKKLFAITLATINLAAMDRTPERMALAFLLNPTSAPSIAEGSSPEETGPSVGQKRPAVAADLSEMAVNPPKKRARINAKSFPCPFDGCRYVAAAKSKLERHVRTHTGEKPFRCPYSDCPYTTAQSSAVKAHISTHTRQRPLHCNHPDCAYATSTRQHLMAHIRTHTGEKPFKCTKPGCTYTAARKDNVARHMHIHAKRTTA